MKFLSPPLLFALVLGTAASSAFAGTESSGGGNAVVCFPDSTIPSQIRDPKNPLYGELTDEMVSQISSIEVLDLYEAKLAQGTDGSITRDIVPALATDKPEDYVDKILRRFNSFPRIANIIETSRSEFANDGTIMEPHGLEKVMDTDTVGLVGSNCVLATMAAQYSLADQYYLHIDQRLFFHPLHSKQSQGVLLLHEYIYRYFREKGAQDSRTTRALVGTLIQNHGLNEFDFMQSMMKLGLFTADPGKQWVSTDWQLYRDLQTDGYRELSQVIMDVLCQFDAKQAKPLIASINSVLQHPDVLVHARSCSQLNDCISLLGDENFVGKIWDPATRDKLRDLRDQAYALIPQRTILVHTAFAQAYTDILMHMDATTFKMLFLDNPDISSIVENFSMEAEYFSLDETENRSVKRLNVIQSFEDELDYEVDLKHVGQSRTIPTL